MCYRRPHSFWLVCWNILTCHNKKFNHPWAAMLWGSPSPVERPCKHSSKSSRWAKPSRHPSPGARHVCEEASDDSGPQPSEWPRGIYFPIWSPCSHRAEQSHHERNKMAFSQCHQIWGWLLHISIQCMDQMTVSAAWNHELTAWLLETYPSGK